MTNRFRILFTPLDANSEKAARIVRATCALHNMLCTLKDNIYIPPGYADAPLPGGNIADGFWRREHQLTDLAAVPRGHTQNASQVRLNYMNWFSNQGAVDWQDDHINRIR